MFKNRLFVIFVNSRGTKNRKIASACSIQESADNFYPKLCKMVRHKLISCSFELRISYTLLQNYTAARCFCMGATLWRSFLLPCLLTALLCLVKIMRGRIIE